jgi:hypothetical protein
MKIRYAGASTLLIAAMLIAALPANADTITLLAGDKDNFGLGAGAVINTNIVVPGPQDGDDFDQPRSFANWTYQFTLPAGQAVLGARLTMVIYDIEDAGNCDGYGALGCEDRLFFDGEEVLGAFDDIFTPDQGPTPAHTTVFEFNQSQLSLLRDGTFTVTYDSLKCCGATLDDTVWIDWAELEITAPPPTHETASVPEPSSLLLLTSGLIGLIGVGRFRGLSTDRF